MKLKTLFKVGEITTVSSFIIHVGYQVFFYLYYGVSTVDNAVTDKISLVSKAGISIVLVALYYGIKRISCSMDKDSLKIDIPDIIMSEEDTIKWMKSIKWKDVTENPEEIKEKCNFKIKKDNFLSEKASKNNQNVSTHSTKQNKTTENYISPDYKYIRLTDGTEHEFISVSCASCSMCSLKKIDCARLNEENFMVLPCERARASSPEFFKNGMYKLKTK